MARKPSTPHNPEAIRAAAIEALMALAAEMPWPDLSLADIARRAGIPLVDLVAQFPTRAAILAGHARHMDAVMMATDCDPQDSPRDRLFEVIMRRLDAMAPDRPALTAILRQPGMDPLMLAWGGCSVLRSAALMLETAGISTAGMFGIARIHAAIAIYLYVFKNFLKDESPDLAPTMAKLDKSLRRTEDILPLFSRRQGTFGKTVSSDL